MVPFVIEWAAERNVPGENKFFISGGSNSAICWVSINDLGFYLLTGSGLDVKSIRRSDKASPHNKVGNIKRGYQDKGDLFLIKKVPKEGSLIFDLLLKFLHIRGRGNHLCKSDVLIVVNKKEVKLSKILTIASDGDIPAS